MSKAVKMDYNTTIEVSSRVESADLLPTPSMVVRSHDSTSVDFEVVGQIMQCAKIAPLEVHMEGRLWAAPHSRGPWSLGQHLARQLAGIIPADPSAGFESAQRAGGQPIPWKNRGPRNGGRSRRGANNTTGQRDLVGWVEAGEWPDGRGDCLAGALRRMENPQLPSRKGARSL